MRAQTVLTVDRAGSHTRLTIIGYDPMTKRPVADISVVFDQAAVRRVIADLCRSAGLPEPWRS